MALDYQVNLRRLTISLIRVYAIFQAVTMSYGLAALLWYLFKHYADVSQEAAVYQDLRDQAVYVIVNGAVLLLLYFQASRIAGWMFAEDEPTAWSGDPYELALPALQITGLVFLSDALLGVFSIAQDYGSPAAADPNGGFGAQVWGVVVHASLGLLFFRNPRWLVQMMKHFSKEAH